MVRRVGTSGEDDDLEARVLMMGRRLYRQGTANSTLRITLRNHFGLNRDQVDRVIEAIRREREAGE